MSAIEPSNTRDQFSEELIQEQVRRIFLCPAFSVSDILRRFLTYIVDETLYGRSNTIKEYTIAIDVLNKPISFKPQHDAIVRIHAGRLRRALNYYYKIQGAKDQIEINVPKGSYVPVFENRHRTDRQHYDEIISQKNNAGSVTIAIMPFKTFEKDKSRLAFTDSLGLQLSAEFGRFPDFSVLSYYTTRQLSLKNKEIHEVASDFGARYIVTGNVQFESRRLRVAVQLTDTANGTQIWTELYHRSYMPSDLFEVADNIVTHIIAALGDFNGLIIQQLKKGSTKNKFGKSCYTTLFWYNDFYTTFNSSSFKKAYAAMEQTTGQDPFNEAAWAFLGELSLLSFLFHQSTKGNPLVFGFKCAQKALKLNPMSQHAHLTLGMANIFHNNKQAGMESLEYALTLNPNASGISGIIGCLMICIGEYEKGISLLRDSIDLNRSYPPFFNLFISLYHFKRKEYTLAYQVVDKSSNSGLLLNSVLLISILSLMGRKTEADKMIKNMVGYELTKTWVTREHISSFLLDNNLVDQLFEGLKSAKVPMLTVA